MIYIPSSDHKDDPSQRPQKSKIWFLVKIRLSNFEFKRDLVIVERGEEPSV